MPSTITPPLRRIVAPELTVDAGRDLAPIDRIERDTVASLLGHLYLAGFSPFTVETRTGSKDVQNIRRAMEAAFEGGGATIRFYRRSAPAQRHYVALLGRGADIVSDWDYFPDDRDGFNAAIVEFQDAFV